MLRRAERENRVQAPIFAPASAPTFAARLDLALKALSMSRGRLAQEASVDKSLVSRWVAGHVTPSGPNLEKVTAALARRVPGFSMLDWERPMGAFAALFGEGPPLPPPATPGLLAFPFDVTGPARAETAKRGDEYVGLYALYRRAFSRNGPVVRAALMLRLRDGLLEARKGTPGIEHRGWALLMLNRLYVMLAEEKFESMAYMIANAGQQPRARVIGAISLSVSTGLLVPKATPSVLVRHADLTGDGAADDAAYEALRDAGGTVPEADVPPFALAYVSRDAGPRAFAEGGSYEITAPYVQDD